MRYLMITIIFIMFPAVFFAQQTYVPDDRFETALIDLGYDTFPLNDSVPTANIDTVTILYLNNLLIEDLTGIEDFNALQYLQCWKNKLESFDLSNNTNLRELWCYQNELTNIDLSNNSDLKQLYCEYNNLTSLNIKNGNNKNMTGGRLDYYFDATDNPDLFCIQVDDSSWSANTTTWKEDDHAVYSEDCGYTGVEEFITEGTAISIFPNPANKNFTVSFELETPQTLTMTLTDLSGTELQEFTLENIQYVNEEIDVSGLSSGVYFLSIGFGSESISRKIVVE